MQIRILILFFGDKVMMEGDNPYANGIQRAFPPSLATVSVPAPSLRSSKVFLLVRLFLGFFCILKMLFV